MAKHAIIYDRASTKMQKDNFSRVNARQAGVNIAEQNGLTWEYVKEIGTGTTLTGRPKLMRILDRIAAGEVQALIVQDLDRLARPEEAVVYSTIRQVIMDYEVIIYTHSSRIDLNDDDDDFVADITMSVAKKERRRILKRIKRAQKARGEAGQFVAGHPGTGYTIVGHKNTADFTKDPEEEKLVKLIFDTLEEKGGNLLATAKKLNAMGHRGKTGKPFSPNTVRWIATRKLYIGIFETTVTDKVTHRPDLQIIDLDQFNRVQAMIKSRAGNDKSMGRRGHYIFTGFVVCKNCGGVMVAKNNGSYTTYNCQNRRFKKGCSKGSTYSEHLILPPIVQFLAELIHGQVEFRNDLNAAAALYGKSATEETLEANSRSELASIQAGKERLVKGLSLGILTMDEVDKSMKALRKREQELMVELSTIEKKTAIMEAWQGALESLSTQSVENVIASLFGLAEEKPTSFRQLLSIVFKPNSLRVKTKRLQGNKWGGVLEGYELTPEMQEKVNQTTDSVFFGMPTCDMV